MHKPQNLPEMVAMARSMETSVMRRGVQKELQLFNKENQEPFKAEYRSSYTNPNNWKMKTILKETSQGNEKQGGRSDLRPRRHNSGAELDEKRRKGICFRCDGQWSREHKCPNKELRVLTVINGLEMEVLDDGKDVCCEEPVAQFAKFSFSSYMGLPSYNTTKMKESIGKGDVIVMLDSGATHNFISPDTVKKLKLKSRANPNFHVRLGTCITVQGLGICEKVSMSLPVGSEHDLELTTDFITLDLGPVDVMLGIAWLRTLGDCNVNWERHELSFLHQGKTVTLQGDAELDSFKMSLKSLSTEMRLQNKGIEVTLNSHQLVQQEPVVQIKEIEEALQQYEDVF